MSLGVEHACVRALWCFSVAYGSFGTGPGLGQVPFSLFSRIFIERDLAFLVLAVVPCQAVCDYRSCLLSAFGTDAMPTGVQHRGTIQLLRSAPAAAPGRPPSSADLARLRPLMSALGDALAAQELGLDPDRLGRTYAALVSELQEAAGMGVHAVELTPATLAPVLPGEGEEGDEKRNAQLAELPEGLRTGRCGTEKRRTIRPATNIINPLLDSWWGLTRLEAMEVSGVARRNAVLKSLPASLGQLGALKQLTLAWLDGLEVLPDAVVRLTSLGTLTIDGCGKLRALPRGIGELGSLKQLELVPLNELQEMPDTLGRMTALEHLTLDCCKKLRTLPASIMHMSRLQTLWISEVPLEDMPFIKALTA